MMQETKSSKLNPRNVDSELKKFFKSHQAREMDFGKSLSALLPV